MKKFIFFIFMLVCFAAISLCGVVAFAAAEEVTIQIPDEEVDEVVVHLNRQDDGNWAIRHTWYPPKWMPWYIGGAFVLAVIGAMLLKIARNSKKEWICVESRLVTRERCDSDAE